MIAGRSLQCVVVQVFGHDVASKCLPHPVFPKTSNCGEECCLGRTEMFPLSLLIGAETRIGAKISDEQSVSSREPVDHFVEGFVLVSSHVAMFQEADILPKVHELLFSRKSFQQSPFCFPQT